MKKMKMFLTVVLFYANLAVAGELKIAELQLENVIKLESQSIKPSETANLAIPALPAIPGKVIVLHFFAVSKSEKFAGCNYNASLEINGIKLGRYTTGGDERLVGRDPEFEFIGYDDQYKGRSFPVFSGHLLQTLFAPDFITGNNGTIDKLGAVFIMDISDIARGVDGNFLKIKNENNSCFLLVGNIEIGWIDKNLLPGQKEEVPRRSMISDKITLKGITLGQAKGGGFSVKITNDTELLVETAIGMDNKIVSSLIADDNSSPLDVNVSKEKIGTIGYHITASWPNVTMDRTVKICNDLVYWNERWTNKTNKKIGVPFRHRLFLKGHAARVLLSGNPDVSTIENAAANPTVFLESKIRSGYGVGVTAENDWLRLLMWLRTKGGIGEIYSETLALDAGKSIDFEFTITPVRDSGGYWTFINNLRDRWGVNNYCMKCPVFFEYAQAADCNSKEEMIRKSLGHLGPVYITKTPWINGEECSIITSGLYPKLPSGATPAPGKCPDLDVNEFLTFRYLEGSWQRQAIVNKTIHRICPQVKVLQMTHPAMEVVYKPLQSKWPWAADVIQSREGLPFESATYSVAWLQDYVNKDWGILYYSPKPSSKYESFLLNNIRRNMDEYGFDGIYSDEFSWESYRQGYSRYDYSYWDGYSADLDQQGNIIKLKADNAFVTAEYQWKLIHEVLGRDKFFLCNSAAALKSINNLRIPRFIEGGNGSGTCSYNHLSSVPLIYGNTGDLQTRKGIFETVKGILGRGCIYSPFDKANLLLEGSDNFVCKLYPITICQLGPGCVKGKERLITTISGSYDWPGYSTMVRLYEYNADGNLITKNKSVTTKVGQKLELQVPVEGLIIVEIAE